MSTTSTSTTISSNRRSWLDSPPSSTEKKPFISKSTPPPLTTHAIQQQLHIGDRVQVNSMNGTIRFIGSTQFKAGTWAGIELDNIGLGKNDGSVDGKRYFVCPPNTGLFILAIKVIKQQHSLLLQNRPSTPHYKSIIKSSKSTMISNNRIASEPPLPPMITSEKEKEVLLLKKRIQQLESENQLLKQEKTNNTFMMNKKFLVLEQTIVDVKRASMESMEILESMVSRQSERAQQFENLLNIERKKNQQLILEQDDLQKAGLEVIEELEHQNQLLAIETKEKQDMLKSHHKNVELLLQDIDVLEMVLQHKMDKQVELNEIIKKEYLQNVKLTAELKGLKKQERYSTLYMRDRLDTPIEEVEEEQEEEDLLDDNILSLCALCEQKGHDLIHCNIILSSSSSSPASSSVPTVNISPVSTTTAVDQHIPKQRIVTPPSQEQEQHLRNNTIDTILSSIL